MTAPELLYHSPEEHVLIFEDLGQLLTLYEYLATSSISGDVSPLQYLETCRNLGSRIGDFFARLHSPEALARVNGAIFGSLENPLIGNLILEAAVLPIKSHLLLHEIPNAQVLFHRVLLDYRRVNTPAESCFVLGDFTPGALLVSRFGDRAQLMGVIDWEFSGEGRGLNGDMAQLLASLHLLLMAESTNSNSHRAIHSLITGICSSYSQISRNSIEMLRAADELAPRSDDRNPNWIKQA